MPYDVVFVDGEFVSSDAARLSVLANVVSYGTGTFEGIRATWNQERGELFSWRRWRTTSGWSVPRESSASGWGVRPRIWWR
ncbi:hypothetical protein ACFQY7_27320 [Actinomadura luteofluorescens]|uniref:hypothetical protein n=1 Tax=Actinomadura luteofluorescens TaxID=46163 RepID=UPI00362A850C